MAASSEDTSLTCLKCRKDSTHISYHKLAKINGDINKMERTDLVKMLDKLHIDSGGSTDILKKRLKFHHKNRVLNKTGKQVKLNYICVIDFEATCEDGVEDYPHEIIEFPAVLIDVKSAEIVDEFQCYCKPTITPTLSNFCKNLTGISQADVDNADKFPKVFEQFEVWLQKHKLGTDHGYAIATDGSYDMTRFLRNQCQFSQVPFPNYANSWINIRKSFSNFYQTRRMNISNMLDHIGLCFEGSQHCGLHDARNIARIILRMIGDGAQFKCNDKLSDIPQSTCDSSKKYRIRRSDKSSEVLDISKCNPNDYLGVDPETLGQESVLLLHK